jgi:hypothetical protein
MSSSTPPNIFHETFIDSSTTNPRGLWPNLHVDRTVSAGAIVPLSDSFEYGGYYLLGSSISSNTTIIQYQYSEPMDLSDIGDFRILYDSSSDIQLTITVRDNENNEMTYSSYTPASSTNFSYNYLSIFNPNFSRINPQVIALITGNTSASILSSVREISVEVTPPVSSESIPNNSLVIYAITTSYDSSKYGNLDLGFRDVFLLPQSISSTGFPYFTLPSGFPQIYQYNTSSNITADKTIVPLPNARGLSGTLGSVENYLPSFFAEGGTPRYTAGCLAAVNKGLCVFGKSNSPTTITVTYSIPPTTLSSNKKVNLQLAYYTQNGADNDLNSRFTLKVQLSNSSGGSPLRILNTALPITQSLSYRYFFTDAEFLPILGESASYDTLTITIGNVQSFSTNRFVATPTSTSSDMFIFQHGASITSPFTIQSISDGGGNQYYFLPKNSIITFNVSPSSPIVVLTVLYDTIFTKFIGSQTNNNTITIDSNGTIIFPYGLAYSGPNLTSIISGNFDISPLPSLLALEYIAINFKRYNMAQSIPQFP